MMFYEVRVLGIKDRIRFSVDKDIPRNQEN